MTRDHWNDNAWANTTAIADLLGLNIQQAAVIYNDIVSGVVMATTTTASGGFAWSLDTTREALGHAMAIFKAIYAATGDSDRALAQVDAWAAVPHRKAGSASADWFLDLWRQLGDAPWVFMRTDGGMIVGRGPIKDERS